jgi:hypothetical protein
MARKRTESTNVPGFPWFAKAVTPHNSNDLTDHDGAATPQTIRVGGAGNVRYLPVANPDDVWITEAFAAGDIIPCSVRKVSVTSTTATALVGYF